MTEAVQPRAVPRLEPTRALDHGYSTAGCWEDRTISSFLDDRRRDSPDSVAVIDGDIRLSYAELAERVDRLAVALTATGVTPGRSVLIQLPNWWEALVAFHAVIRIGAVANPVIPIYRQSELRFIVAQSDPAAIIIPREFRGFDYAAMFADVLQDRPAPPIIIVRGDDRGDEHADAKAFDQLTAPAGPSPEHGDPNDIVLLLYTSGTTAAPKGVLHSHQTLVYECRSIIQLGRLGPDDHIFMGSPVTHITGFLYGFITPAMAGSAAVLLDVWDPEVAADLVERERCRFTVAATPFLTGLTDEYERRHTTSSLRIFACGGADVPPQLIRRASPIFADGVSRIYGSSEFPTYSWGLPGDDLGARSETDGSAIGPVEGRLDDVVDGVGELLVKGPELFHGYLDGTLNEDSFTADGYFRTGDLASFDDSGHVTIQGRKKDIIIRKGENISAREIEDRLFEHPDIRDVAVVALPDPESGERACAVVVSENADLQLPDIQGHLRECGVATQKWPEQLVLVDALPRTASGKVQKFVLRNDLVADTRR